MFNSARSANRKDQAACSSEQTLPYDPLVLAEIVSHVQRHETIIKLSDIKKLYLKRLHDIKSGWKHVSLNSTRFKENIRNQLGDRWQTFNKGKELLISNNFTTSSVLMEAEKQDLTEDDAQKIVKVGLLVRKLSEPVPNILLTLMQVHIDGSIIDTCTDQESSDARTRVACRISYLVISNSSKRASDWYNAVDLDLLHSTNHWILRLHSYCTQD